LCIDLGKKWLGYILGDLFKNVSGHPGSAIKAKTKKKSLLSFDTRVCGGPVFCYVGPQKGAELNNVRLELPLDAGRRGYVSQKTFKHSMVQLVCND
jgi:hypothetical protein